MLLKTGSRYKSLSMEQVFPPNIIICIYVYNIFQLWKCQHKLLQEEVICVHVG